MNRSRETRRKTNTIPRKRTYPKGVKKLVVDGRTFYVKVGRSYTVFFREGERVGEYGNNAILGWSWNDYERAQHKGGGSIYPSDLADWIRKTPDLTRTTTP